MRFVAKQYLKSKVLLQLYNFYIILFTTPSDVHCSVSPNSNDSGTKWSTNDNGDNYLHMLQSDFWPNFSSLPNNNQFFYMQDGAPPHWSTIVKQMDW